MYPRRGIAVLRVATASGMERSDIHRKDSFLSSIMLVSTVYSE